MLPGQDKRQRSQIMSEAKTCDAKICDINRCMIFFLEPLNDVNLMHIKGRNSRVCWCMSVIPGLRGVQQKDQEPEVLHRKGEGAGEEDRGKACFQVSGVKSSLEERRL